MSFSRLLYSPQHSQRLFTSARVARVSSLSRGPAPPRLPKAEQELYENLQRSSTGAFSTPHPRLSLEQESTTSEPQLRRAKAQIDKSSQSEGISTLTAETAATSSGARVQATGKGEELHPDIRRGARPEFEGEKNPKTGEVGGPKNEPLRWGGEADWSYNGRVTDF